MALPPRPRRCGMRPEARVQLLVGWSRICSLAMSTKLLASSPCGPVFEFVRTLGDGKGVRTRRTPFLTYLFLVAGTGFEPVTSGL
jgi:hypothetical protein